MGPGSDVRAHDEIAALVDHHGMAPLPVEGTWFVSTWRSVEELAGGAPVGTAMIGLYGGSSRSLFHRLPADEVWHFYGGDPLRLVLIAPDGSSAEVVLGPDWRAGHVVQHVVAAGTWQAGELVAGGRWARFGCTMAPGFTGSGFEGGTVEELLVLCPDRHDDIERLGVPSGHATAMPEGFAT